MFLSVLYHFKKKGIGFKTNTSDIEHLYNGQRASAVFAFTLSPPNFHTMRNDLNVILDVCFFQSDMYIFSHT